jgi:hydroxymethylglutaryl-CoA lyase
MLEDKKSQIKIVEVGPRDGLQNEKKVLTTDTKIKFINMLIDAGLTTIEATSFVRPDKIPQMKDSLQLYSQLNKTLEDVSYPCLVPNLKGLENAIESNVAEIAIFTATSETFNKKNINRSIKESLKDIGLIVKKAQEHKIKIRAYVSTAFGCPYEGEIDVNDLVTMTLALQDFGAYDISIGDTIGVAFPSQVETFIHKIKDKCHLDKLSMHFHDTNGRAMENIKTSYELGISSFDTSAGGLGGCPYAKGATGNVATEDVVSYFQSINVNTGINLELLTKASLYILNQLQKDTTSPYLQNYLKQHEVK